MGMALQDLIEIVRETPQQLADFLERDDIRELLAATAGTAGTETQTDTMEAANADTEPMVEVAVAEAMIVQAFKIGDERVAREVAAINARSARIHEDGVLISKLLRSEGDKV